MKEMGVDFIKLYELLDEERFYALSEKANQLDLPIASHVPLVLTADTAGPKANSMEHLRNIELHALRTGKSCYKSGGHSSRDSTRALGTT